MGLVSAGGKADVRRGPHIIHNKDCFTSPAAQDPDLIPKTVQVAPSAQQRLQEEDWVKKTKDGLLSTEVLSNGSTVESSAFLAYIQGNTITCTYYHRLNNLTEQEAAEIDFSYMLHDNHVSYLKIKNFQFKMQGDMQYEYNKDDTASAITGEATFFPYFCPNVGDVFLYAMHDGKVGLFVISDPPNRLSIKQATVHTAPFYWMNDLEEDWLERLEARVEDEATFDLDTYLTTKGALLTDADADLKNQADRALALLQRYYNETFYDRLLYRSYVNTHDVYDPYLVEFVRSIFDRKYMPGYPDQLKPDPKFWKLSFWEKLLDPEMVPDEIMVDRCFMPLDEIGYRTVHVTALAEHLYVELEKGAPFCYPFFAIPTVYDKYDTTIPMQITLYFQQGKVRPKVLLQLAKDVLTMERCARFYYIPIIVFLLKRLITALGSGQDIVSEDDKTPDDSSNNSGEVPSCYGCPYACAHRRNLDRAFYTKHPFNWCKCRLGKGLPPCGGTFASDPPEISSVMLDTPSSHWFKYVEAYPETPVRHRP